jgi:hypothetical protein
MLVLRTLVLQTGHVVRRQGMLTTQHQLQPRTFMSCGPSGLACTSPLAAAGPSAAPPAHLPSWSPIMSTRTGAADTAAIAPRLRVVAGGSSCRLTAQTSKVLNETLLLHCTHGTKHGTRFVHTASAHYWYSSQHWVLRFAAERLLVRLCDVAQLRGHNPFWCNITTPPTAANSNNVLQLNVNAPPAPSNACSFLLCRECCAPTSVADRPAAMAGLSRHAACLL